MNVEFIDNHHNLYPSVKWLGRKNAATLGFMPEGGFDDYAHDKCIITASEDGNLMGYLMFRQTHRFSRVVIVHLVVDEPYRGRGIHKCLLNALRDRFQDGSVQGIVLNCRDDYVKASAMWANYGFVAKRKHRSRSYDEKYLTTWWYDFHQKDLFSQAFEESKKVKALLDMNVIVKFRDSEIGNVCLEAKEDPRCLLADWLVDETELCYAPEVFNEINRDENLERLQTTINYVSSAFTEAIVDTEQMKQIAKELEAVIPGCSDNSRSDRKQVASCVAAGIPYFLTYDDGVLRKKREIYDRYGVEVFTPQEFLLQIDQLLHNEEYAPVLLKGVAFHTIEKLNAQEMQMHITAFLKTGVSERKTDFTNAVLGCVNQGGKLYVVKEQKTELAFYGISNIEDAAIICFLRIVNGPLKMSLMCQILNDTLQMCLANGYREILMHEHNLDELEKDVLLKFGFLPERNGLYLKRIKSEVICKDRISEMLRSDGVDVKDEIWTNEQMLRMELSMFPLKIRDLEIPVYIIPIRHCWAGQLFDSTISGETLFGALPSKLWSMENVYYRHTKPITETAPARILWYVSGQGRGGTHRKMIVACSYLREVYTGKGQELYRLFKQYGIYEWEDIYQLCGKEEDKDIRALKFSNTELFIQPICYDEVQKILAENGYKTPNTFAGPLEVTREVFFELYKLGMHSE